MRLLTVMRQMSSSDKIAAFAAVISLASAVTATWAAFAVSQAGEKAREVERAERIDCRSAWYKGEARTLAIKNRSTVHPVVLPFVTIGETGYGSGRQKDVQYHDQVIKPNEELYLALPDWTATTAVRAVSVSFQWLSPDIERPRFHRCELVREGPKRYFDGSESDEWVGLISGDVIVPDGAVVVEPRDSPPDSSRASDKP
jgi:hypothetical protein